MNGLPKPCYVMSEPHLSGYRVVLGYETLTEAQDAQSALAASPPAREESPAEGAVGRLLYEAFWKRNGGNEPAWCDQGSAIRNMWDAIADDALALRNRTSEPEAGEAVNADLIRCLKNIAEGNLGDGPGQANYETVKQVARNAIVPHPAPATADKLRVAVEALEKIADEAPYRSGYCQSDIEYGPKLSDTEMQAEARQALATLNEPAQ